MNKPPQDSPTPATHYTRTAISLHWLIVLLILGAFTLGWTMTDMEFSPTKLKMFNWHKWLGVTVLVLAMVRLVWRFMNPPPALLPMPVWQQRAAHFIHVLLYALLFLQPISGWVISNASGYPIVYLGVLPLPNLVDKNPELSDIFEELHEIMASVLFILISLHALAALKHHFIDRDNTLRRMLSSRSKGSST